MTKHWQGGMIKLFGRTYLLDDGTGKPSREEFTLSIPKSKRNSRSNIEHPEAAYRRGYQQGAHAVLGGLDKAGVVEQWLLGEEAVRDRGRDVAPWSEPATAGSGSQSGPAIQDSS
jgi:hypothetical protein